ncbi:MAG: FlgD immunoglobulin-like domain containing protein [Candidatus Zixiibacteriota bacterium]
MIHRIVIIIASLLLISLGAMVLPSNAMAGSAVPEFNPISRQYVLEGNKLQLEVFAADSDGDPVSLGMVTRPTGAAFTDHGDGSGLLVWQTDFSGPNSSEGSPYGLTFWAGDGQNTALLQAEVVVINNNRNPVISSPGVVTISSGEELKFDVSGYDPDLDPVSWRILDAPGGLEFLGGNPGTFVWKTSFADSGDYNVEVCLTDQFGGADTATVSLNVLSTEVFGLSIDTTSAYPGEYVTVHVSLDNLEAVSGFNIVFNYDVSVLTASSITKVGTRSASFEYFTYKLNNRGIFGDVLLSGIADLAGGVVGSDIQPGSGPIAEMSFYISNNLQYAGLSIPLIFVFRDPIEQNDNSLTNELGDKIIPNQIGFSNGYIKIRSSSPNSLGDINLNGIPYEIGDVIYFTNYFINPVLAPLSAAQWLNSDVNRDGNGGTVADLVYLLNTIVNAGMGSSKISPFAGTVRIGIDNSEGFYRLIYDSPENLGGLALTLQGDNKLDIETVIRSKFEMLGMTVKSAVDGDIIRFLIYSDEGVVMPSGRHEFIEVASQYDFAIKEIQLSSVGGFVVKSTLDNAYLPESFTLYQNYPNPFNPTTEIMFDLSEAASVRLTVYNLLGQEIRSLIDQTLPAGRHVAVWDACDDQGQKVASGIYFYSLDSDAFSARKKMLLLK